MTVEEANEYLKRMDKMGKETEAIELAMDALRQNNTPAKGTWYHFIDDNDNTYDVTCAASFKDAVWEMAKYYGEGRELLHKCLKGFDSDDVNGIVELYNHFAYSSIQKVYKIAEKVYDLESPCLKNTKEKEERRMKSVLISIKPEWCRKIVNGEKTIEVRKNKPSLDTPFKCYIYCTSAKPDIFNSEEAGTRLNSKIIGEFICDRFEELPGREDPDDLFLKDTCLTRDEVVQYRQIPEYCYKYDWSTDLYVKTATGRYSDTGKHLYGWHISNLTIYDKLKDLSEFGLKRPPQSWCYVDG